MRSKQKAKARNTMRNQMCVENKQQFMKKQFLSLQKTQQWHKKAHKKTKPNERKVSKKEVVNKSTR